MVCITMLKRSESYYIFYRYLKETTPKWGSGIDLYDLAASQSNQVTSILDDILLFFVV